MSRSLGSTLPSVLQRMLDGTDTATRVGFTLLLVTVESAGWPRIALLSVGEILAPDDSTLHLALWPGTTTTRELTRSGQATLSCVVDGAAYSVHAHFRRGEDLKVGSMDHAYFVGRVDECLVDEVSYAKLTGGVEFELPDIDAVLPRWQATIESLRRRADGVA
jgi:hypothetical protein